MNKQTGNGAYFPWWVSVIIPSHRDAFRAYGDTIFWLSTTWPITALLCGFVCLGFAAFHHHARLRWSFQWHLEFEADGPRGAASRGSVTQLLCVQAVTVTIPVQGVWVLSGFLLGVTHLKSLLWLARPSGSKNLGMVTFFLETAEGWLGRTYEVGKYFCVELPSLRSLAGDKMMD